MRELLKKHRKDIIIISIILVIAIASLSLTLLTRENGEKVRVTVDGDLVGEYPLHLDATYELRGANPDTKGEVTNILVIQDGVAYLSYANCPDKTCVNTGKIKYTGQSIICLPNRITITVVGGSDGGVDLVS